MNLKNKVIKILSIEHGKKVIQWWKDQGVNTRIFDGSNVGSYYGVASDGGFTYWYKIPEGFTEIELPNELPKRGDRVLVWDDEEKYAIKERVFLAYIEGADNPVIAVELECEEEFLNNEQFSYDVYQNYKPIPKKDTSLIELTMDEALEKLAKLENVEVSRLRIKK